MKGNPNREEIMRLAAEKMRKKKEKEERENNELYAKITSGTPWLVFRSIVVFCTAMALIVTIEHFVDGPVKKLTEEDCKIDRDWEQMWHKILNVEGYMFAPHFNDWFNHDENSIKLTYTPIFKTGKKLSYNIQMDENNYRPHVEIRQRSIFTWFPAFQLFLLIPLVTLIFKRQSPGFYFARIVSMFIVFPGSLMVIYFTML